MNAAFYARHHRAVTLVGMSRAMSPLEVSILLIALEQVEGRAPIITNRLTAYLGMDTAPSTELRTLSWAGMLGQDPDDPTELILTKRGNEVATELRAEISDTLSRWVVRIRVAG